MPPAEAPLSRQASKLLTRQGLLQAAMAVLLESGREGLTTGSVTQRVGVAQPTFYVHFKDMDELLSELATTIVDQLRLALHEARAPLRERPTDLVVASRAAFRLSVRAAVLHADLTRIFLAEQYRPNSPLGARARQLLQSFSDDLLDDMVGLPITAGLPREQVSLVAQAVVGLILQFAQALVEQRITDEEAVVDLLSHATVALVTSLPR